MGFDKKVTDNNVGMKRQVRSTPPTYAPSLVFSHGRRDRNQTFFTPYDESYYHRRVPQMRGMECVSSCYGWLILKSYYSNQCYLFDPVSVVEINLPPLIHKSFEVGVLTCPPSNPNCVVLLVSCAKKKSFIYCRIGDKKWIERKFVWTENSRKVVPYGRTVSITSCEEKVYVFFLSGIVVIDVHDTHASIRIPKVERCEYSIPDVFGFTPYYVESCGEIFEVVMLRLGAATNLIRRIDVFKLDLSRMSWVKVESLGDRIFLLSPASSALVSAAELGIKGNSICFTLAQSTSLYRYDIDDGSITVTRPHSYSKKFSHWIRPFWMVPNCKVQVKKELAEVRKAKDEGIVTSNWLPIELLELVLGCLSLGDCIRFRLTCKAWTSITKPVRSYSLLMQSKSDSQQIPWLLSFPKNTKDVCKFSHPIYSDAYTMNIPELAGAIVRHANYGWLLMSKGNSCIFFFNPTTMETINLPDYHSDSFLGYRFVNISFSSPPTSSDFMVFGHIDADRNRVNMSIYLKQRDSWFDCLSDSSVPYQFMASHCNPVFYDGLFYCLSKDGKLGTFNPEEEYEDVWKVLPVPAVFPLKNLEYYPTSLRSFLVEYCGEFFSFFVPVNKPIDVFKLDRSEMKWVRVESLGDKVAFLSHATSVLVPAGLKGVENRIYPPKFYGIDNMYYSLTTGSFSYFGSKNPCAKWIDSSEIFDCTWFQANL